MNETAHTPGAGLARWGLVQGVVETGRHASFYLESGPPDGPPIIFVHGWPELSWSWRHQLRAFGDLGFHGIAPDLRGCGRSSPYRDLSAFSQREIVRDLLDLADGLGFERPIWVGHDWGSAAVWSLASHHPERCRAAASLCVPYRTLERGLATLEALVNREQYPADRFPAGQFDYMLYYAEAFDAATATFEADPEATFAALMRRPDPSQAGQPFLTAFVREHGGWFGGAGRAPAVRRDASVLSRRDLATFAGAYRRTGFFGADALYRNDADNLAYSDEARDEGRLTAPILFLSGLYDFVCDTERSDLMGPMKAFCADVTIATIASGHWMQQEAPRAVNAALAGWIARRLPDAWPGG